MRVVEVRDPSSVLESLENIREAMTAVYREMISGVSAMTFHNVEWVVGALDDVIEGFEVKEGADE